MKCEACQQSESVKHCVECNVGICSHCVLSHSRFPLTRSHTLITLEEYAAAKSDDPASVQPPVYCTLHPDYKVEFYCDKCDSAICLKCTALNHRGHDYRCVKEAAKQYIEHLSVMVDKVKVKETEANDSKLAVKEVTESLDECYQTEGKKTKEHTKTTIDKITSMIQQNCVSLLTKMKDEYDGRKVNLNAQMKQLEVTENDLSNAREYAENLMRYGNAAQVMSAKKGVSAQMEELLKVETRTDPTENEYMEFQPCDDFCKEKVVGKLIKNKTDSELSKTTIPGPTSCERKEDASRKHESRLEMESTSTEGSTSESSTSTVSLSSEEEEEELSKASYDSKENLSKAET
ncbi:E3 ubiquitin-protein ligase TRIM33-like [Glandiceps talaboti]